MFVLTTHDELVLPLLSILFLRMTLLVCSEFWTVCWTWLHNPGGTIHSLHKGCLFEQHKLLHCYSITWTLSIYALKHSVGHSVKLYSS